VAERLGYGDVIDTFAGLGFVGHSASSPDGKDQPMEIESIHRLSGIFDMGCSETGNIDAMVPLAPRRDTHIGR
jgi:hypothetical protein